MGRRVGPPLLIAGVAALVAATLGGCARSVDFYRTHQAERDRKVQACLTDPAVINSRGCRNATQADLEASGIPAADGRALPR